MVACDKCDKWYHFKCVGVDESIAKQDWLCFKCNSKTSKPLETPKPTTSQPTSERIIEKVETIKALSCHSRTLTNMFSSQSKKSKQLALQRLEEERGMKEKRDKEYLEEKYRLLNEFSDK